MEGDFRLGDRLIQPQLNRIKDSGGKATTVEPKAMEVLVYLAEHSREVLPKERIIQAIWPDTFVTDDVLAHAISELRKALGDDAKNPQTVMTIPRRGYRLLLPVRYETAKEKILIQIPVWKWVLPWAIAGILAIAFLITIWAPWETPAKSDLLPLRRFPVKLSPGVKLVLDTGTGPAAVLSPDGSMLALVGKPEEGGQRRIYVRRLDELEATPLPGTEGVRHPVFSPDGQWIVFRADFQLKKIPAKGGAAVTVCDRGPGYTRGLDWAADGSIIFSDGPASGARTLFRVSSNGRGPEPLTTLEGNEISHRWPQVLPGGETVLFTVQYFGTTEASIVAQRIGGQERKVLWRGGYFARYLPSGHLVYVYDGTLFAVAFNPETLELKGQPVPVVEDVWTEEFHARAEVAFSEKGTLVYLQGAAGERKWTLEWLDRAGNRQPLLSKPMELGGLRFSSDGYRLALTIHDDKQSDIWVYDWERDALNRLTFSDADDRDPVWSPDGGVIAFRSNRGGADNLYWKKADGSGEAHRLTESADNQRLGSWHPGGKYLAFHQADKAGWEIRILPLEGDDVLGWKGGEATTFLSTPFVELAPAFSPDGRWLAYTSMESGKWEVYARPFPDPGGTWQVSSGGGSRPIWSSNGKELIYNWDGEIFSVSYKVEGDSFVTAKPERWEGGVSYTAHLGQSYDLHPDGQRIAVAKALGEEKGPELDSVVFIENFFDYLKEMVPVKE